MIPEDQLKPHLTQMAKEYGMYLKEYINQQIAKNITIEGCTSLKEMTGRQEAVKILRKIFSFIYSIEEKKDELKRTSYE